MSRSKFNNKKVDADGYTFDSIAEYDRYQELRLFEKCKEIAGLMIHPKYEIIPAFKSGKKKYPATFYVADFAYREGAQWIVEDVKGFETATWRIKKKLFLSRYPDHELRVLKV